MPAIGLGTFPLNGDNAVAVLAGAIQSGYRLIDTAERYENEAAVGRGVRASGIPREEIWITSKFNQEWHQGSGPRDAFERSAERLGVDYIDLFMIHWPVPQSGHFVAAFETLLELYGAGRIHAVGTSNFKASHLEQLRSQTGELPDVNQVQCSPQHARRDLRRFHDANQIVTNGWAPLGGPDSTALTGPTILEIASRLKRSPAQVILRWHVQSGTIPIAKSADLDRARANLDVFSFELTPDDMVSIEKLDLGESAAVDSDVFGH
jgi:2,5-diketo-D-gluconate reductase A